MRRAPAVLLATLALAAIAPPAFAGDPKQVKGQGGGTEASERFRAGVAFYKDGDFAAALVEFKRAYELEPNYRVLYNLGQTSQELNDYASALKAFDRYLREGGKEIDAARRARVKSWMDDLQKKVAMVTVETNVDGAEILVDDVLVGTSPLEEAVIVNAGRRKFSAAKEGHTPVSRAIDVAGNDEKTLKLDLIEIKRAEPPPPKPPPPKPVERDTEIPPAAWVMLGLTGASGIAAAVLGGLAVSARGDLDAELDRFPGNRAAIEDAQGKTKGLAIGTDVTIGVTAACAITTAVLFGIALTAEPDAAAEGEPKPEVSVRLGPGSIGIAGAF